MSNSTLRYNLACMMSAIAGTVQSALFLTSLIVLTNMLCSFATILKPLTGEDNSLVGYSVAISRAGREDVSRM